MDHHPKDREILRILVIDVEKQCLVHMDSVLACHIVALSYLWGAVKMLKATLRNISGLVQQDALLTLKDQLPRVVLDAMSVVTMLGERYLWVAGTGFGSLELNVSPNSASLAAWLLLPTWTCWWQNIHSRPCSS